MNDEKTQKYAELFQRLRAGDHAAADEFYSLLAPVIKAMVGRILRESVAKRAVDPTDILHTALRRLIEKGKVPDNLKAWLMRVAKNRLLSINDSHALSRTETGGDVIADTLVGREQDPAEQAEAASEREEANKVVRELRKLLPPAVFATYEWRANAPAGEGTWEAATERYAPPGTTPETWRRKCERALARVQVSGCDP